MAMSKKTPGINGSSMADISFILLIFFLMVTTMGTDYGLIRQLPPMTDDKLDKVQINERNVFVVNINSADLIMAGMKDKKPVQISEIRPMVKEFFNVDTPDPNNIFPIRNDTIIPGTQTTVRINKKAVVSLQNDRATSYKTYILVQNELAGAVNELRNEFCTQHFGKKYDDCSPDEQDFVGKKVYPMSISEAEPVDKTKKK